MLKFRFFLFCLLCSTVHAFAATPDAPKTIRYTIFSNHRIAGGEVDTYFPDGRIETFFVLNDRGRGPKISSVYQLVPMGCRFDSTRQATIT